MFYWSLSLFLTPRTTRTVHWFIESKLGAAKTICVCVLVSCPLEIFWICASISWMLIEFVSNLGARFCQSCYCSTVPERDFVINWWRSPVHSAPVKLKWSSSSVHSKLISHRVKPELGAINYASGNEEEGEGEQAEIRTTSTLPSNQPSIHLWLQVKQSSPDVPFPSVL